MVNPLEFKHAIAGQPYRFARRYAGPLNEDTTNWQLSSLALGAAQTAGLNLAAPAALIQSGARGNRYFTGLSIGYSSLGYPMPLFNYVTPGSSAEKFGAKVGSFVGGTIGRKGMPFYFLYDAGKPAAKIGAKVGARVGGRLIPGVGWGLLAYDVYDVAVNRSLWGFDF